MQAATATRRPTDTKTNVIKLHPDAQPTITAPGFGVGVFDGSNVSESSRAVYWRHWEEYLQFADANGRNWSDPSTLVQWRGRLVNVGLDGAGAPLCVRSINLRLSGVRSTIANAADSGHIDRSIAAAVKTVRGVTAKALKDANGPARSRPNARTYIAPADMVRLVNAPDCTIASGTMHHALLLFLAETGVRISEARTLTVNQIRWGVDDDGRQGWQCWVAGKNKVDPTPRALGARAKLAIDAWLARRSSLGIDSQFVFTRFDGRGDSRATGETMTSASAWKLVRRYASAVGLADIKPHDFRRFVGTQIARKDIRLAQKQLGHADVSTTIRNYVLDSGPVGVTDDLF